MLEETNISKSNFNIDFPVLFSYETLSKGKAYAMQLSTNTWPGRLDAYVASALLELSAPLWPQISLQRVFSRCAIHSFYILIRPWALFAAHLTLLQITLRRMYNVKFFSAVENAA